MLIPRKGAAKDDLAELRREICERYLENPATRIVEFDMPVRDAGGGYRAGVEAWHRAIAARYRALLEAGGRAGSALLVWGDPVALRQHAAHPRACCAAMGLAFERSGGAGDHQPAGAGGAATGWR